MPRGGGRETRRGGDKERLSCRPSPCLPLSLSPCLASLSALPPRLYTLYHCPYGARIEATPTDYRNGYHQPGHAGLSSFGCSPRSGDQCAVWSRGQRRCRCLLVCLPHPQSLPLPVRRRGTNGQLSSGADGQNGKRSADGPALVERRGHAVGRVAGGAGGSGGTPARADLARLGKLAGGGTADGVVGGDVALRRVDLCRGAIEHDALRRRAFHGACAGACGAQRRLADRGLGWIRVVPTESGGPGLLVGRGGDYLRRGAGSRASAHASPARLPFRLQLVLRPRRRHADRPQHDADVRRSVDSADQHLCQQSDRLGAGRGSRRAANHFVAGRRALSDAAGGRGRPLLQRPPLRLHPRHRWLAGGRGHLPAVVPLCRPRRPSADWAPI